MPFSRNSARVAPREERPSRVADELRRGLPAAVALAPLGFAFGALARAAGWGVAAPIVFSVVAFSGAGQLGALAVLAAGGGVAAAVTSAALLNLRFLPMGVSVASSLSGGRVRRLLEAQALTDASWVLAGRPDGTFDRRALIWCGVPQYAVWVLGTIAGTLCGARLVSPAELGLDAIFPAFFLGLLTGEVRRRESRAHATLAALGALLTIALVPVTPPGVPIVAGGATALLAIRGVGDGRRPGERQAR